jgi:hypothetical protein
MLQSHKWSLKAHEEIEVSQSSDKAAKSSGSSKSRERTVDLNTAKQMLPLVKSIVQDIVDNSQKLARLVPEQDMLDSFRRELDWKGRERRYAIQEERSKVEQTLSAAVSELETLGLNLVDAEKGQVDIPTRINGRAAAFRWHHGEDGLGYWHYAGEDQMRPVPSDWQSGSPVRSRREP